MSLFAGYGNKRAMHERLSTRVGSVSYEIHIAFQPGPGASGDLGPIEYGQPTILTHQQPANHQGKMS